MFFNLVFILNFPPWYMPVIKNWSICSFCKSRRGKKKTVPHTSSLISEKRPQRIAADVPNLLDISFFLMRQAIFTSFHLERDQATTKYFVSSPRRKFLYEENLTKRYWERRKNYESEENFEREKWERVMKGKTFNEMFTEKKAAAGKGKSSFRWCWQVLIHSSQ